MMFQSLKQVYNKHTISLFLKNTENSIVNLSTNTNLK